MEAETDINQIEEALNSYIRPQTFPVAIRMATSVDEIPPTARMPKKDWGGPVPACQVITIARRYGWIMAIGKEDISCPIAAITFGFVPAKAKFLDGSFHLPVWAEGKEIHRKFAQTLPRFEYGKYSFVIASPLFRADFEPQVIVIYGNPAQIARLGESAMQASGSTVKGEIIGGAACANYITKPILSNECQFILGCGGDRIFAAVREDEMGFAIPMDKVEEVIEQLELTHKRGERIPSVPFLRYVPDVPLPFKEMWDYLNQPE